MNNFEVVVDELLARAAPSSETVEHSDGNDDQSELTEATSYESDAL